MPTPSSPQEPLAPPTQTIHGVVASTQVGQTPQMQTGQIAAGPAVAGHSAPIKTVFYSRYNGTRFPMPNGHVIEFMPQNGMSVYETSDYTEILELNKTIAMSSAVLTKTPVQVRTSDAHILKDVGASTGAMNSLSMLQTAAASNG